MNYYVESLIRKTAIVTLGNREFEVPLKLAEGSVGVLLVFQDEESAKKCGGNNFVVYKTKTKEGENV
jgi:hypothetical protein